MPRSVWPSLPALPAWEPTRAALHLATQIVGKVRLAQMPWINHAWHVPLYVSACGLTTSLVPHGSRAFEIVFDLANSRLEIRTADGESHSFALFPATIAGFYAALMEALDGLGLPVGIVATPNEVDPAVPFADDHAPRGDYDPAAARAFWQALVQADRVLTAFRARFQGKVSPVHLFWGSLDLAVTRFSGRAAPPHAGGIPNLPDAVTREAYSHEVSSAGFWPGNGSALGEAAFYSYAYPTATGFADAPVEPAAARWDAALGEFLLPYEAVRTADDPDAVLLAFLESTYAAAAGLGDWDRTALDFPGAPV